jgi:hypothetical protein
MIGFSKCSKCDGTNFAMVSNDFVVGSNVRLAFVVCTVCRATIGVLDNDNPAPAIRDIFSRLEALEESINRIDQNLQVLANSSGK